MSSINCGIYHKLVKTDSPDHLVYIVEKNQPYYYISHLNKFWAAPLRETGDRWSWLIALAVWLLYLSHPIVEDHPLQ